MGIQTALVVDDSPSARFILQRLLERQHIRVHVADSAQQALAYLREHRPDVVFMDDMMPDMAGEEAVDRLGADPHTASIPIIMYTGRDYAANTPPPPRRGVIGVLSKPFTPSDVEALLARLDHVPRARPEPARLVRLPAENPAAQTAAALRRAAEPVSRREQFAEELKRETRLAVEQQLGERLEAQVDERIEHHTAAWNRALDQLRKEHERDRSQLHDERLPHLLELLEQRFDEHMERHAADIEARWQQHLEEHGPTAGIGPLQRAQIAHIVHGELNNAVDRPARAAARRVAAELMRGDLSAMGLRLDRLRRRFNRVVVAAAVMAVAAGVGGYLVGMMRFGG